MGTGAAISDRARRFRPHVVAVFLGRLILAEPITSAVVVGGLVFVLAVAIVITVERTPRREKKPAELERFHRDRPPQDVVTSSATICGPSPVSCTVIRRVSDSVPFALV